jgi:predicted nuclease of restriction endonuclease-like (RecB) superfamily
VYPRVADTNSKMNTIVEKSYVTALKTLKEKIRIAQIKASLSVNSEMICLYWEIGKTIVEQQKTQNWGDKTVQKLSSDLQKEFPNMKGFSYRNVKYMKQFYKEYQDVIIGQAPLAQLPWYHNIALLEKLDNNNERLWYAKQTIDNGWSRNILVLQIESGLYQRQTSKTKITNFKQTLPAPQSDLAEQIIKDPYKLDFLTIYENAHERDIENNLVEHITKFLLELGTGFAFVGHQYHLEIGDEDYYIDLLFYHLKLRCYVVLELKAVKFKPEHAGKLNFYLSAVDDILRHKADNPTIGILLCKSKDKVTAEYALKDISKPMGISEYKITQAIPKKLKKSLPSIEDIEKEFSRS